MVTTRLVRTNTETPATIIIIAKKNIILDGSNFSLSSSGGGGGRFEEHVQPALSGPFPALGKLLGCVADTVLTAWHTGSSSGHEDLVQGTHLKPFSSTMNCTRPSTSGGVHFICGE